mmetsp:Transcript_41879/g.82699  ORF Transcript_41879/g.82699 Transcript_41879/m.82699 type:complete len:212 (-) Transcript_41879:1380-2015(-)
MGGRLGLIAGKKDLASSIGVDKLADHGLREPVWRGEVRTGDEGKKSMVRSRQGREEKPDKSGIISQRMEADMLEEFLAGFSFAKFWVIFIQFSVLFLFLLRSWTFKRHVGRRTHSFFIRMMHMQFCRPAIYLQKFQLLFPIPLCVHVLQIEKEITHHSLDTPHAPGRQVRCPRAFQFCECIRIICSSVESVRNFSHVNRTHLRHSELFRQA